MWASREPESQKVASVRRRRVKEKVARSCRLFYGLSVKGFFSTNASLSATRGNFLVENYRSGLCFASGEDPKKPPRSPNHRIFFMTLSLSWGQEDQRGLLVSLHARVLSGQLPSSRA